MAHISLSRREWLHRMSVPALSVPFAGALTAGPAAEQAASRSDPLNGARVYNIRDFGAKGDGTTLDTAAVQTAIDTCNRDGGGTVLVPAGVFHVGTLELKSDVTLHLAATGTLLGSADGQQYHAVDAIPLRGDSTLGDGNWALIFAVDAKNVRMDGLHIYNRVNNNNDGFHFISSEHVAVSNCIVQSQDDACALFGSCKFVTVTNCTFSTRWSVFRFGGGVAENITVSNCVLHQVYGCPFKFHGSPGSRFENMSFSNLVLQEVTGPISISVGPPPRAAQPAPPSDPSPNAGAAPSAAPGIIRNISFSNIHGTVTTNPPQLPDYPFTSVHLTFEGGGTAEDAARRNLPETAGEYFELGPMPAYGLYARNARALTLQNVRFREIRRPSRWCVSSTAGRPCCPPHAC